MQGSQKSPVYLLPHFGKISNMTKSDISNFTSLIVMEEYHKSASLQISTVFGTL